MLLQGGKAKSLEEGVAMSKSNLANGLALEKFKEMVVAQGGSLPPADAYPEAPHMLEVKAHSSGYVSKIDALEVGLAAVDLGAGRRKVTDGVDYTAGVKVLRKTGSRVEEGDVLATVHTSLEEALKPAGERVLGAFEIEEGRAQAGDLITNIVRKGGVVEDFDMSVVV